jgi:hypothetical protein
MNRSEQQEQGAAKSKNSALRPTLLQQIHIPIQTLMRQQLLM